MNITPKKLKSILDRHAKWLDDAEGGERADLSGADLSDANLWGANLSGANLSRAKLSAGDNMNKELIAVHAAELAKKDAEIERLKGLLTIYFNAQQETP
jgi:uncharacterized protein YjbI with pentapeptide repeats